MENTNTPAICRKVRGNYTQNGVGCELEPISTLHTVHLGVNIYLKYG
jgi:hypothetical protein